MLDAHSVRSMEAIVALAVALVACDGGPMPDDAGRSDSSAVDCAASSDCDDGAFCNGAESCASGACAAGSPPCTGGETCDEANDVCVCGATADADGDGVTSPACGGTDCDDGDPEVFPGAAETCDAERDEDCDASTIGERDTDGDGHIDAACCNGAACGDDCDDADPGAHPTEAESCGDGADNDCDGVVDEGTEGLAWYRDADGDGWGTPAGAVSACASPGPEWSMRSSDCDDTRAAVHPGAREDTGDGIDNDCDGRTDERHEIRGGITTLGEDQRAFPYRLSRQRLEGLVRSCAPAGFPCVSGGIVSGTEAFGRTP